MFDEKNIPLDTQDLIRLITKMVFNHRLGITTREGYPVKGLKYSMPEFEDFEWRNVHPNTIEISSEDLIYEQKLTEYHIKKEEVCQEHDAYTANFFECYQHRKYDKVNLSDVYLTRDEIRDFCLICSLPLPAFWFVDEECNKFQNTLDQDKPKGKNQEFKAGQFPTPTWKRLANAAQETHKKFWGQFNPKDRRKSSNREEIEAYLQETFNLNGQEARIIQSAIRDQSTKYGGTKAKKIEY
ncbi:MAG: hypothetical protein KUG75_00845 [Pseudomonadales bacterium]|nr:hypothetical protein [Pseudomonadales bacterium]